MATGAGLAVANATARELPGVYAQTPMPSVTAFPSLADNPRCTIQGSYCQGPNPCLAQARKLKTPLPTACLPSACQGPVRGSTWAHMACLLALAYREPSSAAHWELMLHSDNTMILLLPLPTCLAPL